MIAVRDLAKRYGALRALDGASFDGPAGEVTGLVGPNGAGKSTTLAVLLGLVRPDAGTARIDGLAYPALVRPLCRVGAMLDAANVDGSRTGLDHLAWMARANGLDSRRPAAVAEEVGLGAAARRVVRGYSLGMKVRLGIAGALLGDPPVLIFDEPFNGLDPEATHWLRQRLQQWAAEGRAVLLSTHQTRELEQTATRLVLLRDGRVTVETSMTGFLSKFASDTVLLRTASDRDAAALLRGAGADVSSEVDGGLVVRGMNTRTLAHLLAARAIPVYAMQARPVSLESAYLRFHAADGGGENR